MGFWPSPTERTQFFEALKLARVAGWSDVMLAKSLRVSNGDLKNMLTEHKSPSPKHISRLNELLLSNPPRRIPPPAPSRPVVTPPKFSAATPSKPPEPRAPSSPEAAAVPSDATPEGGNQLKEDDTMQTTSELNGASHRGKTTSVDNGRYQLLPAPEVKVLRHAMNEALRSRFGGELTKMAAALEITASGLRKTLRNKGSISEMTKQRFTKATGWKGSNDQELNGAGVKHAQAKRSSKPGSKNKTLTRLTNSEAAAFRRELERACNDAGSMTAVADGMGVNRNTLALILSGTGSTQETLGRFRRYLEGQAPPGSSPSITAGPGPRPKKQSGTREYIKPEQQRATLPPGDYDLYEMAGRLLGSGRPEQAHVLSLVARVSEVVPMEKVTSALNALVYAATG